MNIGGAADMLPSAGSSAGTVGNLVLTPEGGWVDGQSNAVGIQGSVYTELDALLGGPSTLSIESDGPALCVSGVAGPVRNAEYARDWGVLFGIRLGEASPDQIGTWSQITPVGTVSGFTFRLAGPVVPRFSGLRFQVQDGAGTNYCTGVAQAGTYSIRTANMRVACWEEGGASVTPELPLVSLSWMIATADTDPIPYDFCVEDLTVVLQ